MEIEKFRVDLRSLRKENEIREQDLELRFKDVEALFREMLGDADKYYVESFEDIKAEVEKVRVFARDSVKGKEQLLSDAVQKLTTELRSYVDDNVDEMVRERRDMV